jgi:hypothetical protein
LVANRELGTIDMTTQITEKSGPHITRKWLGTPDGRAALTTAAREVAVETLALDNEEAWRAMRGALAARGFTRWNLTTAAAPLALAERRNLLAARQPKTGATAAHRAAISTSNRPCLDTNPRQQRCDGWHYERLNGRLSH